MDGTGTTDKDYYYILGVAPNATAAQIKAAYDQLYDRFGPHVNLAGQDPEIMLRTYRNICEAYEVLIDPAKRQEYDKHATLIKNTGDLRNLWGKTTGPITDVHAQGAEDTLFEIDVTLREALKGCLRQIRIEEQLPCKNCISMKPVQRLKC